MTSAALVKAAKESSSPSLLTSSPIPVISVLCVSDTAQASH
jgi:hypothetical protein